MLQHLCFKDACSVPERRNTVKTAVYTQQVSGDGSPSVEFKKYLCNSRGTQKLAQETIKAFLSRSIPSDSHLGSLGDSPWCNTSYTVNNRTNKGRCAERRLLAAWHRQRTLFWYAIWFSVSVCACRKSTRRICVKSLLLQCAPSLSSLSFKGLFRKAY